MVFEKTFWRKRLLLCLCVVLLPCVCLAGEALDEMLEHYQESRFAQAFVLASSLKETEPRARLVYHLCQLYNTEKQDLAAGFDGLRRMVDDAELKKSRRDLWAEAALGYARLAHVFQLRGLHEKLVGKIDAGAVLREVMDACDDTAIGCTAAVYFGDTCFLRDVNGKSLAAIELDESFAVLEKFVAGYKGAKRDLTPLHLYLDVFYVDLCGDYASSFKHLRAAYEAGIVKATQERVALFRLARMCDLKLERKEEARRYYGEFLRKYPEALRTPLVTRYLRELDEKGK